MEREMFELDAQSIGDVAGGKIIESKDGEFFAVPDQCKGFKSREEAEHACECMKKCRCDHGKHHGHPEHPNCPNHHQ